MQPPPQPLGLGASALIFDGAGRVLLIRENYGRRRYSLPGGEVEPGEAPHDAVIREAKEETGLSVTVSYLVAVYWFERPALCPYALFGFKCEIVGSDMPSIPNADEIAEVGWFRPEDFPAPSTVGGPLLVADAAAGLRGVSRTASLDT